MLSMRARTCSSRATPRPIHQSYEIFVTVRDVYGYNNSDSVLVDVARSELVAAINGGDRTISINSSVSEGIVLESASYDPDSGNDRGMYFNWTCIASASTGTCAAGLSPAATTVVALETDGVFEFTLTVSKYDHGSWRSASTSATITVTCALRFRGARVGDLD